MPALCGFAIKLGGFAQILLGPKPCLVGNGEHKISSWQALAGCLLNPAKTQFGIGRKKLTIQVLQAQRKLGNAESGIRGSHEMIDSKLRVLCPSPSLELHYGTIVLC